MRAQHSTVWVAVGKVAKLWYDTTPDELRQGTKNGRHNKIFRKSPKYLGSMAAMRWPFVCGPSLFMVSTKKVTNASKYKY